MNKRELTAVLAEKQGLSLKEAGLAVDELVEALAGALAKGEEVKLAGFGTFAVKNRAARKGMVPGTDKVIQIPAKKAVVFRASKSLKERI